MGQRHQQFINVTNPRKLSRNDEFKMFNGRRKNIVLPFHNQWLYGRRAPLAALRVLEHTVHLNEKDRNGKDNMHSNYHTPFTYGGMRYSFDNFKKYISSIEFILNYSKDGDGDIDAPGFGGSWFLGDDEYKTMSEDFTMGDNNDGVTLIDVTTNKYCFINISNYNDGDDELSHNVWDLPYMQPVDALTYMRAYYGETKETANPYHIEHCRDEGQSIEEYLKEASELNASIAKRFEGFEVMTLADIKKMFPKMELNELTQVDNGEIAS